MPEFVAGSVVVPVVPSTRDFVKQLRDALLPAATRIGNQVGERLAGAINQHVNNIQVHMDQAQVERLGQQVGQEIGRGIRRGLGDEDVFRPFREQQQQQRRRAPRDGDDVAGGFARGFKRRLEAAMRALPEIELGADSTDADRKMAELRARLAELSGKEIGVDISDAEALAQMAAIQTELERLRAESPNIQIQADIAGALAQMQAVQSQVDRLARERAEIKVDVDIAGARDQIGQLYIQLERVRAQSSDVQVHADVASALERIRALQAQLSALAAESPSVQVQADTAQALAQMRALQAELARISTDTPEVEVRANVAAALAQIQTVQADVDRIQAERASVQVDADTGRANAQLAATNAEVSRLDGRRANINVVADVGGALASLASLKLALIGLGAAAAPALVGVGAGIVGLAGPLAAAGAGFGGLAAVALPAISNVSKALQQQKTASQQASGASSQAASRAFAEASARQQLASAIRNAAYAHQQALDQVRSAEQQYQQSLQSEADAQRALAQARLEARRSIEDLKNQVIDAQLSLEEQRITIQQSKLAWDQAAAAAQAAAGKVAAAQQALADAQAAQTKILADPGSSDAAKQQAQAAVDAAKAAVKSEKDKQTAANLAVKQAAINYKQSVQRLKEQQIQLRRLQQDEGAAAKAGVEGSDQVRAARERLAQANQQVANSELALQRARQNVARTDQQSADQVASARRAMAQATLQGASANAALGASMAKLTPLQRQLMTAWTGLTGAFTAWSHSLEPDVIPVLIRGIGLLRTSLPLLTPIVHGAAGAISQLLTEATAAARSPFWTQFSQFLGQAAGPAILGFGHLLGSLITGLAGLAQAFAPIGFAFLQVLNTVAQRFAAFMTGLASNPAFKQFTQQFIALAPLMAQTFLSLGRLLGGLFAALAPALQPALGLINTLASALAGVLRTVGPSIQSVLGTLGTSLSAVIVALAPVVTQLVQALAPLLNQLINGLRPILISLVPVLGQVIAGLAPVISALLSGLQPAIQSLVPVVGLLVGALAKILLAVAPVLPLLGQFIARLVTGLMPVLTPIVNVVAQVAQQISGALIQALVQSAPALQQMVLAIAGLLPELVPLVPLWGQWFTAIAPLLPVLIQLAAVILQALLPVIRIAIQLVVKYWTTVFSLLIPVFRLMVTVITWVAQILTPVFQFLGWLIRGIGTAAQFVWNIIKIAFGGILLAGRILAALIFVFVVAPLLIAFNLIKAAALFLWQYVFIPVWHGIAWAARQGWALLQPTFAGIRLGLRTLGSWMTWLYRNAVVPAWNGIKTAINFAWGIIRTVFNVIVAVIRVTLAPVFRWLYNSVIKPVWSWIGSHIRSVYNSTIRPTFDMLKDAVGKVRDAFHTAVTAIGKIWDGLKDKTRKPVAFVVNTVYTHGIKKAWDTVAGLVKLPKLPDLKFATGGVFPGYTPGRDPHVMPMAAFSGGEGVIRPEATRALGPSWVYGINAAAMRGGVAGAANFAAGSIGQAFAGGGIIGKIGGLLKGAKNLVVHGASSLLAKGASFAAKRILDPILKQIPAGDSPWTKAMSIMPRKMIDNFVSWLQKTIDPKLLGSGDGAKAVAFAIKQLGKSYVWGATGPDHFDCSGLTMRAWEAAGKEIGRTTYDQVKAGRAGSRGSARPGDLHFPEPGHVMMFVKPNAGGGQEMIHAPHTGDVVRYAPFRGGGKVRLIASSAAGGVAQSAAKARAYARSQMGEFGWSGSQYDPLNKLWIRESGWRWNARNAGSGAYGIPQALPASKMRSAGADYLTNAITQVRWGLGYIKGRYGSPAGAWAHSQRTGWYDNGGFLPPGPSLVYNGTGRPEPVLTDAQWRTLGDSGGSDVHYHAHFDGLTGATIQSQVRAGIQAEMVLAGQRDRTSRRR